MLIYICSQNPKKNTHTCAYQTSTSCANFTHTHTHTKKKNEEEEEDLITSQLFHLVAKYYTNIKGFFFFFLLSQNKRFPNTISY